MRFLAVFLGLRSLAGSFSLLDPHVHVRVRREPDDLDDTEVLLDDVVLSLGLPASEFDESERSDRRRARRSDSRMVMVAVCVVLCWVDRLLSDLSVTRLSFEQTM